MDAKGGADDGNGPTTAGAFAPERAAKSEQVVLLMQKPNAGLLTRIARCTSTLLTSDPRPGNTCSDALSGRVTACESSPGAPPQPSSSVPALRSQEAALQGGLLLQAGGHLGECVPDVDGIQLRRPLGAGAAAAFACRCCLLLPLLRAAACCCCAAAMCKSVHDWTKAT